MSTWNDASLLDVTWDYADPREYVRRVARGLQGFPPLIITVAITGAVQGKEANPNLPETPEEQAQATYEAWNAGASIVHVHARRPENMSMMSHETERYAEVNALIREKCSDVIINNTMAGDLIDTPDGHEHFAWGSLYGNPEIVALDCGPMAYKVKLAKRPEPLSGRDEDIELDDLFVTTHKELEDLAREMKRLNIKPEFELYSSGQYTLLDHIIDQGLADKPYLVQWVLGAQNANYPTPWDLLHLMRGLPQGSIFSVIGVGAFHLPLGALAIALGGHVRVGLEDNIYYRRGQKAKSNAQLVERVVRLATEMGRRIATPAEARKMLGLSEVPSQYQSHVPAGEAVAPRRHREPDGVVSQDRKGVQN